jgi:adenylate cyclase
MTVRGIRIHLRLGIALAFLLTVVPLFAGMLTYLYHQNSRSALSVATDAIGRTSSTIINDLRGLLSPVARVAEATAMFGKIDRNGLRRIDSLRYFADAIEKLPQLASLYIGFVSDGAFFNLIRLPDDSRFGPNDDKPPEGTRMALRMLDASSGSIADSYFYLSSWGQVVGVERSAATHDPRKQEWFSNAWQRPGANLSDAFVFPATGRPGLAVSHRVATDDGVPIAVVGADVELDALAALLDSKRIGRLGVIFLIDETGRVICHNRADLLVG